MNKIINLNIACGEHFIVKDDWINLDYEAVDPEVTKCDILDNLPLDEGSISNIYTSHFIEHVPLSRLENFLKNCFKVLIPGGVIRIITPDFNEMCQSYVEALNESDKEKADFIKIEILDQLVRVKVGGTLRNKLNEYKKLDNKKMLNLVKERLGPDLNKKNNSRDLFKKSIYQRILNKIMLNYILIVSKFLPKAFRQQNLKFTNIGENHTWIWDKVDLTKELLQVGFSNITIKNLNESQIQNFPFELDIDEGIPRKGSQSMCIEAIKKK